MRKIILFLIISSLFTNVFSYDNTTYDTIKKSIDEIWNYQTQISKIDEILENSSDKKLNTQLTLLKNKILQKNLISIIKTDWLVDLENNFNNYKKSFLMLQTLNPEAWINPYYFKKLYLETQKKDFDKQSIYYKSLVYLFSEIKNNIVSNPEFYKNYKSDLRIALNQTWTITKISESTKQTYQKLNLNYLSKWDLNYLKNYITKNNVSTDSKMFKAYLESKFLLDKYKSNSVFLTKNIENKLQKKYLSCELNTTSLYLSYVTKTEVLESEIYPLLKANTSKIQKKGSTYIWGDPDVEFVWDINWFQTKNYDYLTWYWVYEWPIISIMQNYWIKTYKSEFTKENILNSLLNDNPVMFWYILPSKSWTINTKPLTWQTQNKKQITAYVWEHTWLIIWADFDYSWEITKVYYYEWTNKDVHIENFADLEYKAKFLDKVLLKKD